MISVKFAGRWFPEPYYINATLYHVVKAMMANKVCYLTTLAFIRFPLDLRPEIYIATRVALLKRYNLYPRGLIATIISKPKYTEARKSPQDHSAPRSPTRSDLGKCSSLHRIRYVILMVAVYLYDVY